VFFNLFFEVQRFATNLTVHETSHNE